MSSNNSLKSETHGNGCYKVCLDYGEAYGNLGEEAMLISAMDRLNRFLGDCTFVIPVRNGKPLPDLGSDVRLVSKPFWVFRAAGRLVRACLRFVGRLPYAGRFVPSQKEMFDTLVWKTVDRIMAVLLPLLLRFPSRLSRTINALRTCDVFYSVGSGAFNDYNLPYFVYRAWLYETVRPWVKVSVVSSHGLGPLSNPWAKKKMTEAFENLDFLSFRDCRMSQSIIEELAPRNVRYSIVGDETFSLSIGDEEQIRSLLDRSGLRGDSPFVAFHFRTTDCINDTSFLFSKLSSVLDEICRIVPHNIVFFPMSYDTYYDKRCGSEIKELMAQPERLLLAPLCKDARVVKGAVGRAVYSLGLSYHLHVFALSQDKPAIILYTGDYYKCKSEGLIGFYGEPCSALDLELVSIEDASEAVQYLEDNYEAAIKKIAAVNKQICDINDWHLRELRSKLAEHVKKSK